MSRTPQEVPCALSLIFRIRDEIRLLRNTLRHGAGCRDQGEAQFASLLRQPQPESLAIPGFYAREVSFVVSLSGGDEAVDDPHELVCRGGNRLRSAQPRPHASVILSQVRFVSA